MIFSLLFLAKSYYKYMIDETIGMKEENRTIEILNNSQDEIKSVLTKNNNIQSFYSYYQNFNGNIGDFIININFLPNNKLDIDIGKEISNKNEVLITKDIVELYKVDLIKNSNIKVTIENQSYEFKVVGIIKSGYKMMYVHDNILEEIAAKSNIDPVSYIALVKNYTSLNETISTLRNMNLSTELFDTTGQYEIDQLKKIERMSGYMIIISLFILIIMLSNIIKNIYYNEEKNISILKTVGFRDIQINLILFLRIILLIIIEFSILFIIYFILYGLFIIFNNHGLIDFLNHTNIMFIFLKTLFANVVIACIINIVYIKKIKKMNILEVLNEY